MALYSFLVIAILFFISLVSLFSDQAVGYGHVNLQIGGAPPAASFCIAANSALHGYECQEFHVTTTDGYILSVQRITKGLPGLGGNRTQPVLLQHGLLADGLSWFVNSAEQNLPTILADNGFDVWISNVRGTLFSRQHVNLSTSDPEYWNWTFEDLALKDLHSVVDFVLGQTGQKVHYIGHSMGTLMALVAFSESNLVDKLKSAVLLCPVAYLGHMTSPAAVVAARLFLADVIGTVGFDEFDLRAVRGNAFLQILCADPLVNCYDLLTAFTGRSCCLNESNVNNLLENEPQPTSVKNLIHFSQIYRSGRPMKFDYKAGNIVRYGRLTPPIYDLTKISRTIPLFLGYGGIDSLSDPRGVQRLLIDLQGHDPDKLRVQFVERYGHLDFILAYNAKVIVYDRLIEFFGQFS